jgi:hypothetical protein
MLPRLEAEEALSAINVAALAAGGGEPLERERIFAALHEKASGEGRPAPQKADPADLAGMGIAVRSDGGDLPTITDRDAWLGNSASSSAAVGEQEPSNG